MVVNFMVMMLTISPHHKAMLGTWLCCIDFGQCAIACVLQSVHHECLVSSAIWSRAFMLMCTVTIPKKDRVSALHLTIINGFASV